MKISYNWLKEYLPGLQLSPQEAAKLLTMTGLEVESVEEVESIKGGLKGVVVGEVLTKTQHPNADRLSLTTVDVGGQVLNIVCGASNVAAGQKVLVATVGSVLHTSSGEKIEIKKSKIRGEASEGMICAEDELGLGDSHEGIMVLESSVPTGTTGAELFNLSSDYVLEIGLTPNRTDATSHFGVARDLRAAMLLHTEYRSELRLPDIDNVTPGKSSIAEIESVEGCPRYTTVVLKNVKVGDAPAWMKQRLAAVGIKSINSVVDITNYVMMETGQPLHAFDFSAISGGKVKVMHVPDGTPFITLDGTERKLSSDDVMICDANGSALCIAGVYGGMNSGVKDSTTTVLLESACFNPVYVRKTAKRHGLKTDASFRFERGTDPEATMFALQRAVKLLKEISGAEPETDVLDLYPSKLEPFAVTFRFDKLNVFAGTNIPVSTVKSIVQAVGIDIKDETSEALQLAVPRFKADVTREIDVIEEVLRIYGFNNIPVPAKLNSSLQYSKGIDKEKVINVLSESLVGRGFSEVLNNSLTKSAFSELHKPSPVKLLNPLSSELEDMRTSMLFPLLENIAYNINRKSSDLKFFEFGYVYSLKDGKYNETQKLALIVSGNRSNESWLEAGSPASFFYLKSVLANVLERSGFSSVEESFAETPLFSDALALAGGKLDAGIIGLVKPSVLKKFDIEQPVYYAEVDVQSLIRRQSEQKVEYRALPKFPSVRRDLALLINEAITYGELEKVAFETEKKLLKKVNLFDVYRGKSLEPGKKSYALSFLLQDENATLNDKQIDRVMQNLQDNFTKRFEATIRR